MPQIGACSTWNNYGRFGLRQKCSTWNNVYFLEIKVLKIPLQPINLRIS
jgi:hypothetical protein